MRKQSNAKKKRNALYYSLAVCVVAGFVAAFTIFGSSPTDSDTLEIETTKNNRDKAVAAPVTDIPDTRDNEADTTDSTTQTSAPDFSENIPFESSYILPLSTDISRDYSDGEFVYCKETGDYRIHQGIDFSGNSGDNVVSIISGVVVNVYSDNSYGNIVEINHGNMLVARYCGLNNVNVTVGTMLSQGDVIGTVGLVPVEGASAHIHFETLIDGVYEDPLAVMGKT